MPSTLVVSNGGRAGAAGGAGWAAGGGACARLWPMVNSVRAAIAAPRSVRVSIWTFPLLLTAPHYTRKAPYRKTIQTGEKFPPSRFRDRSADLRRPAQDLSHPIGRGAHGDARRLQRGLLAGITALVAHHDCPGVAHALARRRGGAGNEGSDRLVHGLGVFGCL